MGPMRLVLERDDALGALHLALARARTGHGEVALVAGEAGAGKTTVVDEFLRQAAGRPIVHRGGCDPLATPRPLGPLIDAVASSDADLAARLAAGANRAEAFAIGWSLLAGDRDDDRHDSERASILVIEDVHWADDTTLDLVTFLGRRIASAPALLVLTHRDDEVGRGHPLRARLGELGATIRTRVNLGPLSVRSVAALADGTGIDPDELHRATGGNPFFVTEVLAAGGQGTIPASVRDAVLARTARLPVAARTVLDAAAIVPGRVERWLLAAMTAGVDTDAGLDLCIERGLLHPTDGHTVTFRHELARVTIDASLTSSRRRELHRRALAALRVPPIGAPDDARLAHHAGVAEDADAVLAHAPRAATEAVRVGAHREAERQLSLAVHYADRMSVPERAELLERRGAERVRLGRHDEAIADFDAASELYSRSDDVDGAARAIARTGRPLTALGREPESVAAVQRASELLAGRPVTAAAALVATYRATNLMLARRLVDCEIEAGRAIALAEATGADDVLAEACIQTGIALAMSGDDDGLARIRRGIEVARRCGNDQLVALAHSQIGSGYGELRRYDVAVPALREGLAFAEDRELIGQCHYLRAWLARCLLETGRWDEAGSLAGTLLRTPRADGISRFVALVTTAWLRMRRGDPDVTPLLDEAADIATSTRHVQRMWPVAACRAEAAWLSGRLDGDQLLGDALALAQDLAWAPAIEELSHWSALAGEPRVSDDDARTPFGLSAAGRHDQAADAWHALGCPYEEAMARFLAGSEEQLRAAFVAFDELGAAPMRARSAAALREIGAAVPRAPSPATRQNPFELTSRELQVLGWLATGRTNPQIARALGISPKTVGHHVSRVLTKLGVATRAEAAVTAAREGLTGDGTSDRPM